MNINQNPKDCAYLFKVVKVVMKNVLHILRKNMNAIFKEGKRKRRKRRKIRES